MSETAGRGLPAGGGGEFTTTHWSTILAAGESASPQSHEALERLCLTYWYPLYAFVRRRGYLHADACDLTQAFFERMIEKRFLRDVLPARGRFRTFLLAALTHFLANEWDRSQAAKRGGGTTRLSLDTGEVEERYQLDAPSPDPPERHFDRLWAQTVMEQALTALEAECRGTGKAAQFDSLVEFLSRPPDDGEYARVGAPLGLNPHAVAMAVSRLRQRYAALVRAEIAHTLADEAELDAEVRYLIELASQ